MALTTDRQHRLQRKLQDARGRLLTGHPFFALLLMYLRFVAVPGSKKMSTNGNTVYFSPDFVDKLYPHELDFALCHQVMHILLGHIWRPSDLAGDDYHFACDILVNHELERLGWPRQKYAHLGEVHYAMPGRGELDLDDITPDELCALMPFSLYVMSDKTRNRFLFDRDDRWGSRDNDESGCLILDIAEEEGRLAMGAALVPGGGDSDADDDSGLPGDGAPSSQTAAQSATQAQAIWQGRAASASKFLSDSGGKGVGNEAGLMERIADNRRQSLADWRKLLDDFVQEQVCDYSFTPPDRRFSDSDFFLPDFNERDFAARDVLFMVDTSGSVDDDALGAVYSEICGAIEQFGGKLCGQLGFFDTEVASPNPFQEVGDVLSIVPKGGGGTDFCCIFRYIRMRMQSAPPACVVIFTDGFGPYPDKAEAMDIPTLWLLDNDEVTPPFGLVARLPSASKER